MSKGQSRLVGGEEKDQSKLWKEKTISLQEYEDVSCFFAADCKDWCFL